MSLTLHAAVRSQQCSIPPLIVDWLLTYGDEVFDGHGGVKRYFSKRSRRKLEHIVGKAPVRKLSEYLGAYLVESSHDGEIITVAHRNSRIRR